MRREHIAAPGAVNELVQWAAPYCPADIAAAVVLGVAGPVRETSWLVAGGSLSVDDDGLSYRRRTVVEPRWAYSESFVATWREIGSGLRENTPQTLEAALGYALARHRMLARGVALSAQAAVSVWCGPDSVVRAQCSTTADLRRVLAMHARTVLTPLVMLAARAQKPVRQAVSA